MNFDMLPNPSDTNVQKLIDEVEKSEEGGILPQTTPVIVSVCTESYSEVNHCFLNVEEKTKKEGGVRVLGWTLRDEKLFMSAEFHAVWESPNKELLDITPKATSSLDPTKKVTVPIKNILFIAAPKATYEGKQRCSIYFNSSENPLVNDLINYERWKFYLMNKGERPFQYGEITLSDKESKEYEDVQQTFTILQRMVRVGMKSYNSDCGCSSGGKYKHCHGKNFRKIIEKGH